MIDWIDKSWDIVWKCAMTNSLVGYSKHEAQRRVLAHATNHSLYSSCTGFICLHTSQQQVTVICVSVLSSPIVWSQWWLTLFDRRMLKCQIEIASVFQHQRSVIFFTVLKYFFGSAFCVFPIFGDNLNLFVGYFMWIINFSGWILSAVCLHCF